MVMQSIVLYIKNSAPDIAKLNKYNNSLPCIGQCTLKYYYYAHFRMIYYDIFCIQTMEIFQL